MRRHSPNLTARPAIAGLAGLAALAALAALVAGACLAAPRPSDEALATGTPAHVTLEVGTESGTAQRFAPAQVSVTGGAQVRLVFRNESTESHNLSFTGSLEPIHTRTIVEPGQQEALTFTAPTAGVYPFVCTIHIGMGGELRIFDPPR